MSIYTTKPPQAEYDKNQGSNTTYRSMWGSKHKAMTYSAGERKYAGLYLGYSNGMVNSRSGISAPWVQDFFQNGVHTLINSPYFDTGLGTPTDVFMQARYSNPWTLY